MVSHNLKYIIYSLLVVCAIVSCRPNETKCDNCPPEPPPPEVVIEKEVLGYVADDSYNDLVGASITMSKFNITSDNSGFFYGNPLLPENRVIITAQKNNYFNAYSLALVDNEKLPWIKLIQNRFSEFKTVSGDIGGTLEFNNSIQIKFESSSFLKADSTLYKGDVIVYVKQYIPSNPADSYSMPLNTQGKKANGDIQYLKSYTGLAVELRTSSGENLSLAKDAFFKVPVIGVKLNLSDKSQCWNLNTKTAYWEEKNIATKNGNFYEFRSKDIQTINIANGLKSIMLSGKILVNGIASRYDMLLYQGNNQDDPIYSIKTNELGNWKTAVPANVDISLDVLSTCNLLYNASIGAFQSDTRILDINLKDDNSSTLGGYVYDCNGAIVKNGHVIVKIVEDNSAPLSLESTSVFNLDKNGKFKGGITLCQTNQSIELTPYDRDHNIIGNVYSFGKVDSLINLKLNACKSEKKSVVEIQYKNNIYTIDSCTVTFQNILSGRIDSINFVDEIDANNAVQYKLEMKKNGNQYYVENYMWKVIKGKPSPIFQNIACATVKEVKLGTQSGEAFVIVLHACKMNILNDPTDYTASIRIESTIQ